MAKGPDTPCAGCGKLLWSGPGSKPAGERRCRTCIRAGIAPVAPLAAEPAPAEQAESFGARGARLWRDITSDPAITLSPAKRVLLEEVCRSADRLDKLDDFLAGRGDVWLRFRASNEDGSVVRVVVDRALSEVRQQQDTLRGLIADMEKDLGAKSDEEPEASGSDDLAKRREDRRRAAGL